MIKFIYYLLCCNDFKCDLGDLKNRHINLIVYGLKQIYLSFDGFVPEDVSYAYIIHSQEERPNTKYLNYYPKECCLREAARILKDILRDCGLDAEIEYSETINVTEYYEDAIKIQENKYKSILIDYM